MLEGFKKGKGRICESQLDRDMNIEKFTDITLIRDVWELSYSTNSLLTPFQAYNWNLFLQKKNLYFINKVKQFIHGRKTIEYWIFSNDFFTVIAPIIIYRKERKIFLFGQQDMTDYLSFIYATNTPVEFLVKSIKILRYKYSQFKFVFDRINENNIKMRNAYLLSVPNETIIKKCVKIQVVDNLILKINSDSRRYWKQACKRVENDKLELCFSFNNKELNRVELSDLWCHYNKRYINKFKASNIFKVRRKIKKYIDSKISNEDDMVSLFFENNINVLLGCCWINKNLAAYMLCTPYIETMHVLRISIDDNNSEYRPGILLIVEAVRYLSNNLNSIKYLDLSRGDEPYKMNYGGLIHNNYCFEFEKFIKA